MDAETDDMNGKACTPAGAGAQLPERAQAGGTGAFNKKLCPLGILAFLLLLIAGLWLLVGGAKRDPLLGLIPAAAQRAEIYNCSPELRGRLAELELWAKPDAAAAALAGGVLRLEFAPVADAAEWKEVFPFVTRAARVFLPQGEAYLLESVKGGSGNGWDIERMLSQKIAHGFVKDRDTVTLAGEVPARRLSLPNLGTVFALRDGNYLALSRSTAALEAVVACRLGKAQSLADLEGAAGVESTREALLIRYVVPAQTNLLFPGVSEAAFRPDAAVLSVVRPAADGLFMASKVLTRGEGSAAGHGFFHYVAMALLLLLALVVGLPALFIATTLLLAAYFYLAAWWRGEVIPLEPYELPELSKEMKEDIAAGSAKEQAGTKAGAAGGRE